MTPPPVAPLSIVQNKEYFWKGTIVKLLYCEHCHDIFKPGSRVFRSCECGRVKGRYINSGEVEVSPEAVSIAIGNESLREAIADMRRHQARTEDTAGRDEYYRRGCGFIRYVWVRPNNGPGNPRSRLIEDGAEIT